MGMLAACMALFMGVASADDRLQVHGFLTQTAVHTDTNNFGGESEDGIATDMRELGLNLSFRPDSDWLFSAQALSRWAGEMDDGELRMDYAFVERNLMGDANDRVSLQVGKIKNPYGFYNTTRDVAHTRPGVLMPQAIYMDRMRHFFLAAPGASLRGEHEGERFGLGWQVSGMRMEADDPELDYLFLPLPGPLTSNAPGHFEGSSSWLGQAMLDIDGGRWRVGLSFGDVAMEYRPAPVDFYPTGKVHLKPKTLSLQHNRETLTLTAEYSQAEVVNSILAIDFVSEGWYAQATWRFAPHWQTWIRNETIYFDKDNKDGSRFIPLGLEDILGHSKAWVVGLRRDITPQLALSAEVHKVDGVAMLSPQDNPGVPGSRFTRDWEMLLLQVAYRF